MAGLPHYLFGFFILNCFISFNFSLYQDYIPCTPVGVCKCKFPNGLGVDLSILRGYNFSVPVSQEASVVFYPCKNVDVNDTSRNLTLHVSLYLHQKQTNQSLGTIEESSFVWRRIRDEPAIVFSHNNKTTNILLKCDEDIKNHTIKYLNESSKDNIYNFRLISNLGCVTAVEVEGRSVFTTILMIVLFLFLVYFFGGFCVLRFIRGARGWEAIPNGEFWKSVISGTKQMFLYLINGCKHPDPYDTI